MIKGYITLKQASEISGKEVEALKKQCQTGRIRGAIKQGKTWFVPHSEIVVDETGVANGTLSYLMSLVEAVKGDESGNVSFGVTLVVNGVFIQGDLISKHEYLRHFRNSIIENTKFEGEANKEEHVDKFHDFTNKYFDQLEEINEQGIPTFIHLKRISTTQLGNGSATEGSYLRIKSQSIDGFMLGKAQQ